MFKSGLSKVLFLTLILGMGQVQAAKPTTMDVQYLKEELEGFESELDEIYVNYTQRRGLIGKNQAEDRFEKALVRYMLGDYKRAAPEFFILLETGSLSGYSFEREAEWYLADSAFRIGQYSVVEEASYAIIEQGVGHVFFTDAVRLLLESYGVRNRPDKFQEVMERFVLSGLVDSSDQLNYSIGKSLFWQDENARAKAALLEIAPESSFYFKAQYFLGGVYASEGGFVEALEAFENSYNPDAAKEMERELNDLANLAVARMHYALGDFTEAVDHYQKVRADSKYFLDKLYEMAWAFIGMERWEDAIGVIEVFLVAYPEDEHAIKFQNTLGDLYMKTYQYEKALVTYESVSEQLQPLQDQLNDVMSKETLVKGLLDAKIEGSDVDYQLPEYAHDMLVKNRELELAAELVSLSREQSEDIQNAQAYADEIQAVLDSKNSNLYTYERDRRLLNKIEAMVLDTLLSSLETETSLLIDSTPSSDKDRLKEVQVEIGQLRQDFEDAFNINVTVEEMMRTYTYMVDDIQNDARDTLKISNGLLEEVEAFGDNFGDEISNLPLDEQAFIQSQLEEVKENLLNSNDKLTMVSSGKTKATILGSIQSGESRGLSKSYLLQLQKIHNELLPYWGRSNVKGKNEFQQNLDGLWTRARDYQSKILDLYEQIDKLEGSQRGVIAKVLAEQQAQIDTISDNVIALATRSEDAGATAAMKSFENLSDHIEDRMLGADLGIVKVYWIRKTDIEDEIMRLKTERANKTAELQTRFELISSKLSAE